MDAIRAAGKAMACFVALLLAACNALPSSPTANAAPFLIQVENLSDARPQSGLQDASIVYEYVTEGDISRFSAIYLSPPNGRVGPIRSARLVTISLAKLYGSIVVFSGGSTYIKGQIQSAGVPNFDENSANGDLFRDNSRAAPHNLYTDGSHLSDLASHANAPQRSWSLWNRTSAASVSGGRTVSKVTVPVSESETPTFTYDSSSGGWKRSEPDTGAFVDANTGTPVVVSTLIVQQVAVRPTSEVVDVNGATGVDHDVTGSGQAQVFTAGREFDATWNQPSSGPPSFNVGGQPAPIAPGLVWICLVPTGTTAT
ncbi:MAG TPA: DUF3048 domain-containing protein [Candidatus Dormibacteraeota bacterium]|nr:DUF3048 domain-containing protein [Candidatus Dormibacteraeota bacterium]